jgi:Heterokaryon incompatibility protein (HET)
MSNRSSLEHYQYEDIHTQGSFRVLELLPGKDNEPISFLLLKVDWTDPPEYEAVSYTWGDPNAKVTIICHGKKLEVGRNIHNGLTHLRFPDRSRILWIDCLW